MASVLTWMLLLGVCDGFLSQYDIRGYMAPLTQFNIETNTMEPTADDLNLIMKSCFEGAGMDSCTYDDSGVIDDLTGYSSNMVDFPFAWASEFPGSLKYCLQCCGNHRLSYYFDETFPLVCNLDSFVSSNVMRDLNNEYYPDYEFRFARYETSSDTSVTRCALERTHREQGWELMGYNITIWVEEQNNIIGFWRGVRKCEALAFETNDTVIKAEKLFYENIRLLVNDDTINAGTSRFLKAVSLQLLMLSLF